MAEFYHFARFSPLGPATAYSLVKHLRLDEHAADICREFHRLSTQPLKSAAQIQDFRLLL